MNEDAEYGCNLFLMDINDSGKIAMLHLVEKTYLTGLVHFNGDFNYALSYYLRGEF